MNKTYYVFALVCGEASDLWDKILVGHLPTVSSSQMVVLILGGNGQRLRNNEKRM